MRAFILDTNILMAYLKANNSLYTKVSDENKLNDEDALIMISAITKGEILSLAMQNKWGERKLETLNKLLNLLVTVDVSANNQMLMNAYAEIDSYSLKRHPTKTYPGSANPMGKNDMWIAATAFAVRATLLTTDTGFMHLDKEFIDIKLYSPNDK